MTMTMTLTRADGPITWSLERANNRSHGQGVSAAFDANRNAINPQANATCRTPSAVPARGLAPMRHRPCDHCFEYQGGRANSVGSFGRCSWGEVNSGFCAKPYRLTTEHNVSTLKKHLDAI